MRSVIILGATSAIAQEVGKCFAGDGDQLFLVARDAQKLAIVADDLKIWGAPHIETYATDLAQIDEHSKLFDVIESKFPTFDHVFVAYGNLPDQKRCEENFKNTEEALRTNFLSVVSLLTYFANAFERKRSGHIAVVGSVAGDRGRQSNYVYGTAKGALSIFLQGLRNRLAPAGVPVLTIKPGFVDTPMTAHLKKGPLFAKPDHVGREIFDAILKKKDVIYTPGFWWFIMRIIKSIPEKMFKKLKM